MQQIPARGRAIAQRRCGGLFGATGTWEYYVQQQQPTTGHTHSHLQMEGWRARWHQIAPCLPWFGIIIVIITATIITIISPLRHVYARMMRCKYNTT